MNQKLAKSEVKMKQILVELEAKISLFGSVFGAQRYRNDSTTLAFFQHI